MSEMGCKIFIMGRKCSEWAIIVQYGPQIYLVSSLQRVQSTDQVGF